MGIAHYASVMRRQGFLAVPAVVLAMLLAGCQSTPSDDLQGTLAGIAGVESVYVDANRVKATLDADIVAADAETAIVALRDQAVAGHSLGDAVELVVVIDAGSRDFGGPQPWEVYSYGKWSFGAAAGDGFGQQAAFLARLADWETLLTTPAQILHVQFAVSRVDAPGETPAPDDAAAPAEEAETETEAETPDVQTREIELGQSLSSGNVKADIDALIAELGDLWVASGGVLDTVRIR